MTFWKIDSVVGCRMNVVLFYCASNLIVLYIAYVVCNPFFTPSEKRCENFTTTYGSVCFEAYFGRFCLLSADRLQLWTSSSIVAWESLFALVWSIEKYPGCCQ